MDKYTRWRTFDDMNSGDVSRRLNRLHKIETSMRAELKRTAAGADSAERRSDEIISDIKKLDKQVEPLWAQLDDLDDDDDDGFDLQMAKIKPLAEQRNKLKQELVKLNESHSWGVNLRVDYLRKQLKEIEAERCELHAYKPPFFGCLEYWSAWSLYG